METSVSELNEVSHSWRNMRGHEKMSLQGEVPIAQMYLITLEPKTPKLHLKPGRPLIGKLQMERIRLGGFCSQTWANFG